MVATLSDLNPENFAAFMKRLHQDAGLKADVIQGIAERGFVAVLEQFFKLSERQEKLMAPVRSGRGPVSYWEQVMTMALISNGNISITHGQKDEFEMDLSVNIPFVGSMAVSISC